MIGMVVNLALRFDYEKVLPANTVLSHVENPTEEQVKFLEELGEMMVTVNPFGMVVGQYLVEPFLISQYEYYKLLHRF